MLHEAASFTMKLPRAEQKLLEWQAATEALIMAAGRPGIADACARWRPEGVEP
jgi:hypothetical protein